MQRTFAYMALLAVFACRASPALAQSHDELWALCTTQTRAFGNGEEMDRLGDEGRERRIRACTQIIDAKEASPRLAIARVNRAEAYRDIADFDRAIADYDEAIALEPGNAAAFTGRAAAQRIKRNDAAALADYDRAIALDPKNDALFVSRAGLHKDMGHYARAVQDYDEAMRLRPDSAAQLRPMREEAARLAH